MMRACRCHVGGRAASEAELREDALWHLLDDIKLQLLVVYIVYTTWVLMPHGQDLDGWGLVTVA